MIDQGKVPNAEASAQKVLASSWNSGSPGEDADSRPPGPARIRLSRIADAGLPRPGWLLAPMMKFGSGAMKSTTSSPMAWSLPGLIPHADRTTMELDFSPEQQQIKDAVRHTCRGNARPAWCAGCARTAPPCPRHLAAHNWNLGWLGLPFAESYGGAGSDWVTWRHCSRNWDGPAIPLPSPIAYSPAAG